MNTEFEIDVALRELGGQTPPFGIETRVIGRLDSYRGLFGARYYVSAGAIAAGLALCGVALTTALHEMSQVQTPRIVTHSVGAFGSAASVRVQAAPIKITPIAPGHGRGRARAGHTLPLSPLAAR